MSFNKCKWKLIHKEYKNNGSELKKYIYYSILRFPFYSLSNKQGLKKIAI